MAASGESSSKGGKKWFPLESNPEVMNSFMQGLGWPTERLSFMDILSTDDWALDMIPKPVQAVLFLYPIKATLEEHEAKEAEMIKSGGQVVDPNLFYMRQTVSNACGTVALMHACCNAIGQGSPAKEGSWLEGFFKNAQGKTPDERAALLEEDDKIEQEHDAAASEGQTERSEEHMNVDTHFIAFVHSGGHLYELDGRKAGPINHGPSTKDTLLPDACKVIRRFMERDPGEMRFTMVALAPSAAE
eukprot:m.12571 g.12571  ORF g.12571 m.12571 type:complete len:245 (+) comp6928_c0_seq1:163-897(+)